MKLTEYVRKHDLSTRDLANMLACSQSVASRVVTGKRTPSAAMLARIFTATNGAVTPADFEWDTPVTIESRAQRTAA